MSWFFEPPFLLLQTAALALGAAGAAVWLYARWELRRRSGHRGLIALRGLVVGLLALVLLNPVVRAAAPAGRGKAPFILLFDTSRSMNTPDAGEDGDPAGRRTRWNAVRKSMLENTSLLDGLSRQYDLRVYGFDDRALARTPEALRQMAEPAGSHTDLGDAISQAVNSARPASGAVQGGMLLVSDGRDNGAASPTEAAHVARSLGFPVYTLCLGQETQARSLEVVAKRPQTFAAPGQTVELEGGPRYRHPERRRAGGPAARRPPRRQPDPVRHPRPPGSALSRGREAEGVRALCDRLRASAGRDRHHP
ncbi:MAG TPA: vWA domain-containing protein [Chthonomonadaceae bacterium]|nr:vWA domain-containing protein [Chthonomonadaceae bacterium]